MNIITALDILCTTYEDIKGSGITRHEGCVLLNAASISILRSCTFAKQGRRSEYQEPAPAWEQTQYSVESFQNLLCDVGEDKPVTTDKNGFLSYEKIQATFPDSRIYDKNGELIDVVKPEVYHINSVDVWSGSEFCFARWMRRNDRGPILKDPFDKPTKECPRWEYVKGGIKIYPASEANVKVSVLRMPVAMSCDEKHLSHPEFSDVIMMDVIYRALALTGVAEKDYNLYQVASNLEGR